MPDPLALIEDLASKLGVDIDAYDEQAERAIQDASAFIRAYTGQEITEHLEDEVELIGNWKNELQLPQLPVIAVEDVVVRYGGSDTFYDVETTSYTFDRRGRLIKRGGYWGGSQGIVRLTYDHGYEVVPDDIEAVCLAIAARFYRNPSGFESETIGQYSYRFGDAAPAAGLSTYEQSVLQNYRNVSV